ncbi:flagellar hook-associated protein FlgL [Clostridium sp. 'White wine YQ']|uniref:flagellar hook-associated protein FlgL n=1 Tax=Clostridium sp. 'White wine YQ' TaxID=3027474 RepID=UPI002365FFBC|nr:flagellar hook-associated protein FlgL [Clostridium sp. 'White wine YQ']MDD7794632.1 flagellar hook-associated protein FlgL [Clostridium sp. 'White wine YQ']
MRVTNRMLSNNYLSDMRTNLTNMQKMQQQLSSGKEIRKPSDNPFKVARSMQLTSDMATNVQYNENIKDTINWLDATDTGLGQVNESLQRIRELMVSSGNAAYGSDEKKAIKDEVNEKVSEIAQILNTNFDGRYIFGGTKTTSKPIKINTDALSGNNTLAFSGKNGEDLPLNTGNVDIDAQLDMIGAKMDVEVSQGVTMQYNVNAKDIVSFTSEKGKNINLMDLLGDIVNNLGSSNPADADKLINENLEDITTTVTNVLKVRAEVGAKQNRMDSAKDKNEEENYNMTDILSKTEDIDITQKMMEYSMAQTVYTASLQTSARIIQPSLMDFLK